MTIPEPVDPDDPEPAPPPASASDAPGTVVGAGDADAGTVGGSDAGGTADEHAAKANAPLATRATRSGRAGRGRWVVMAAQTADRGVEFRDDRDRSAGSPLAAEPAGFRPSRAPRPHACRRGRDGRLPRRRWPVTWPAGIRARRFRRAASSARTGRPRTGG